MIIRAMLQVYFTKFLSATVEKRTQINIKIIKKKKKKNFAQLSIGWLMQARILEGSSMWLSSIQRSTRGLFRISIMVTLRMGSCTKITRKK
jgi:hypothetical protein